MLVPAEAFPLPPVAARFVRYTRIDTRADPTSPTTPSSPGQRDLARLLTEELRALGAEAETAETGVVYARLPSTLPPDRAARLPRLGLVAHLDTAPDLPGGPVRPHVVPHYRGEPILLPGDSTVRLDLAHQPALLEHLGHDLLVGDGTTLLGSDDKAGVAVIVQLAEDLLRVRPPHPELRLLFTVDEEIGRGIDGVDLDRFGAEVAYTFDGEGIGGIDTETFWAAEATLTVEGVAVHPGYAKNVMANAVQIAAELASALPAHESPASTTGREGFYFAHALTAEPDRAVLRVLLRDFEADGLAERKAFLEQLVRHVQDRHPRARIALALRDEYPNLRDALRTQDPRVVAFALEAARDVGLDPVERAVRGGTDGARLSARGIPTPNLFTGGHAFHSRFEWNSVQNLETTLAFAHALVHRWAESGPPDPPPLP